MSDKTIGRFEPIGDDKGPKRAAFDVLTKEPYEWEGRQGWQGLNASGFGYSILSEHWQWVPAVEFEVVDGPVEPADGGLAFGTYKQAGQLAVRGGGISVRDYFAAKALQGFAGNDELLKQLSYGLQTLGHIDGALAAKAYALADAMLQERAK